MSLAEYNLSNCSYAMNIEQLAEEKYVKCNTGESTQGLETKCPFSPKKLIPTAAGLDAGYLKNGL
jgi:hypothetical protein